MGYYDKERVRGFLHNQDGIIVNDFGEEVILRGWGMGNWDNPEGFMLGTQSGFGLFEPGKYAPMGRMDRGRSMDQILRETCGTKYAEEFRTGLPLPHGNLRQHKPDTSHTSREHHSAWQRNLHYT